MTRRTVCDQRNARWQKEYRYKLCKKKLISLHFRIYLNTKKGFFCNSLFRLNKKLIHF